jgi:hypothetical protein
MYRQPSFFAMVTLLGLAGGQVEAGGPPMLCLPIDGVTAENAQECTKLLSAKLENKLFPPSDDFRPIEVREFGNQWYVTFFFVEDVALSEVEAALNGSSYSIPRDRLHFFGHILLEIDAGATPPKDLMAGLDALEYISVGESDTKQNRMLLAVDMPYPKQDLRRAPQAVNDNTFQWNDLSSDPSAKSQEPATAEQLPNYSAFNAVLARHDAKLHNIRWTVDNACRAVGAVAVNKADGKLSKTAQAAVAR